MWIKYDNRARGDGSARRGGGRGLILGVGDGERARGEGGGWIPLEGSSARGSVSVVCVYGELLRVCVGQGPVNARRGQACVNLLVCLLLVEKKIWKDCNQESLISSAKPGCAG